MRRSEEPTNSQGNGPESVVSNSITVSASAGPPGAPTGVSATGGDTNATVSWIAPADVGTSPITGYTVSASPGVVTATAAASATTATLTGLINKTSYTFTVHASNAVGDGPESSPSAPVIPGAASSPSIVLSASQLSFTAIAGGGAPAAQTITIFNGGPGNLATPVTSISYQSGSGWLLASVSKVLAPYTISVSPSVAGLVAGTYSASVSVAVAGAANSPQSIAVTFTVSASPAPAIVLNPALLTFAATQGGASPQAQSVSISNGGAGALAAPTVSTTYQTGGWVLSATVSGAAAPYSLTVTPTLGALPAGTYQATVSVSSAGATNTPQTLGVTFTVNSPPPTLSLTPASLSFTTTQGSADPAAQTVAISNSGGSVLAVPTTSVSYLSGDAWAAVTLSGASAPYVLGVQVKVSGLAVGTYQANVIIASAGATNTPATLPVTLTITRNITVPGAPTNVSVGGADVQRETVYWQAPVENGGSAVTGFVITPFIGATAGTPTTTATAVGTIVVTGLANGTTYTFRVAATNAVGTGPQSGPSAPVTTVDVPGVPRTLSVTLDYGRADLTWANPASNGGLPVTGFAVSYSNGGAPVSLSVSVNDYGTYHQTLEPLTDGSTYTFTVAAINAAGTGAPASATRAVPCGSVALSGCWPSLEKYSAVNYNQPFANIFAVDLNHSGKMGVLATSGNLAWFAGRGNGRFDRGVVTSTARGPFMATVGDFNGDGISDVIFSADDGSGTMTLTDYLGSATGTFTAVLPSPGPLTGAPLGMVTGDVDLDGKVDVVIAVPNGYTVLLGGGDGKFPRRSDVVLTNTSVRALALADLNADGKLDLVLGIITNSGTSIAVLLGNGDGTFQAPVLYPAPATLFAFAGYGVSGFGEIRIADVNKDGKPDVLVVGETAGLIVYLNGGSGTLLAPTTFAVPTFNHSLVLGDVNNDGNLDAVVGGSGATFDASSNPSSPTDNIHLLLGDGKGGFAAPVGVVAPAVGRYGLALADFDGDGKLDIAATNLNHGVFIIKGLGDGTFVGPQQVDLPPQGWDLSAIEVDGPGKGLAAVVLGGKVVPFQGAEIDVLTYRLGPTGLLQAPVVSIVATRQPTNTTGVFFWTTIVSKDLNGDGYPDLIATENFNATQSGAGAIDVLLNNKSGGFVFKARYTVAQTASAVAICDVNGDGKMDAVVNSGPGTIYIFPGNGDGTFGLPYTVLNNGMPGNNILCGDVNGDGKADLLNVASSVGLIVALGNGDFTFQPSVTKPSTVVTRTRPLLLDVNGDHHPDVVVDDGEGGGGGNSVSVFLGNGAGGFLAPILSPYVSPVTSSDGDLSQTLALADVDGDGKLDAVIAGVQGVGVLFGAGDGSFANELGFPAGGTSGVKSVIAADFNGDGLADVAAMVWGWPGYGVTLDVFLTQKLNACY